MQVKPRLAGYEFGLVGASAAELRVGYRVLKQKYEDGDGPSPSPGT